MEFSNLFFLYLFLPLCVGIYFLAPGIKLKNTVLILFSILFYCFDRPVYVPLVCGLAVCNYGITKLLIRKKTLALLLGLAINIGIMVYFKLQSGVAFPLGLSFYVFSLVSYQVDVFRHPEEQCSDFWQFLLFVTFFPKIVMGPITRYSGIASQIKERAFDPKGIFEGCFRFTVGLSKKILLADPLFRIYEQLGTHSSWIAPWGAGLAFMLYIYLEFSGYCDMAIGMGKVFGFTLPENFDRPFTADSVGMFWRRWHITLGSFFKDYVYIPMGGNRRGVPRQVLNLFVVWILTGVWHGVSLTFVIWGMYFFILLTLEKGFCSFREKLPSVLGKMITFVFIYFGWIIFAAKDLSSLVGTVYKMLSFTSGGLQPTLLVFRNSAIVLAIGFLVSVPGPLWKFRLRTWYDNRSDAVRRLLVIGQWVLVVLLLALCTVSLIGTSARPSMYAGF